MAIGVKAFNPDGSLMFDIGSRLFRRIAVITYGNGNGSAGFARNNSEDNQLMAVPRSYSAPEFTVNPGNNTVSWDFSAIDSRQRYGGVVEIWAY